MSWTVRVVRIGEFRLDAGCMFGLIPRDVWTRWLPPPLPDEHNRMVLQQNALLLERDGTRVVVEVGIGDKMSAKEQAMYAMEGGRGGPGTVHAVLHGMGCDAKDISTVIVTHLHFDHAGGITRLDPARPDHPMVTFPSARIISQRQEWDDAIANKSTMNKTYLRTHLTEEIAERMTLVEGEVEVAPGIRVIPMPGHTWGQQGIAIDAVGGKTVVFIPDVMPTRWHCRPTTNLSYDVEPYTSMITRTAMLDRAADEKWTLVLDHEPGHPVFTVKRDPEKPGAHVLEETGI